MGQRIQKARGDGVFLRREAERSAGHDAEGRVPAGHQAWTPHAQLEGAGGSLRRFGRREMEWTGHVVPWGVWAGDLGRWQIWGWIGGKYIKNKVNEKPRLMSSREEKLVQKKKNDHGVLQGSTVRSLRAKPMLFVHGMLL